MRSQSFGYRFAMLYRMNRSMYAGKVEQLGVTAGQVPFIAELMVSDDPPSQDQLSGRLAIDKAATARAMTQLEKKGLVTRRINPENRRQKLIYPTSALYGIADELLSVLVSAGSVFVRGFSEEEKKVALELMDRMLENARNETGGK